MGKNILRYLVYSDATSEENEQINFFNQLSDIHRHGQGPLRSEYQS